MLAWFTGARNNDLTEDRGSDPMNDTYIEPPETPAPVFAVRAFKHAIFGTPQPVEHEIMSEPTDNAASKPENALKAVDIPCPVDKRIEGVRNALLSPTKAPAGILMTPGTAAKGRKTVSFGAHVVDNEGKKSAFGKSGLPNDCPGKFPSPWTPKVDAAPTKTSTTKLTAALYEAKESAKPKSQPKPQPQLKPKAKDDNDITLDVMEPRSESGKYWKQQYEAYAEKSEKEVKKLVAKQQLAKNYAKKKDSEAMELASKLTEERKRHKQREQSLEEQMKDYQERLKRSMDENLRTSAEVASLKQRFAALETALSKVEARGKSEFPIHEDVVPRPAETAPVVITELPRRSRRSTLGPDSSPTKYRKPRTTASPASRVLASQMSELPPKAAEAPLPALKAVSSKENVPPMQTPEAIPASPDPWTQDLVSSIEEPFNRLALPISSTRPMPPPRQHRQPHTRTKPKTPIETTINTSIESSKTTESSLPTDRRAAAKERLEKRRRETKQGSMS